jgi:hypothetical protein
MTSLYARGPRLSIRNLYTLEGFFMQFNPTTLTRNITVNYQRYQVLGAGNQPLDYLYTGNMETPIELFFYAEDATTREAAEEVMRFLEALAFPPEAADSIGERRPPRCLVVWPNTLEFTSVVRRLQITHRLFDQAGRTTLWRATIGFEEAPVQYLTQEEVRLRGPLRSADQGE